MARPAETVMLSPQYEIVPPAPRFALHQVLRVLMVVTGFPSAKDPATGIFNLRAAQALNRSVPVTVVHLRSWLPFRHFARAGMVEGIPVWTLAIPQIPGLQRASRRLYEWLAWPVVKRLLKDCDIVHSVGASFACLVGAHWARLASVHHVTQITSEVELNSSRLRPDRKTMRSVHGVACNSEALSAHFRRLYPDARNVRTVFRGVDLERFRPDPTAAATRNGSGVRFLFLGGFPEYRDLEHGRNTKGGETLLNAWRTAEERLAKSSAHLVLAGPGSTDKAVQRWRAQLQYPERVQLAGPVDPADVVRQMIASDAVLVPSLQEGFPNVALEAAACARSVLASRLDGIGELVVHGETGALLPAGDTKAWESALIDFAGRRGDLLALGRNARQRAEKYFDANAYPGHMIALYHAALREPLERKGYHG